MRSFLCAVLACAVHHALGMYGLDHAELHHRSICTPIPANFYLCHNIEYARMRMPNLLGHETLSEAVQQAAAWVPLVHKRCHADTRKFLCALFAPVCLEEVQEPIRPCRSLCQEVRSACAPLMAVFGFPWPEMLECSRFPEDNDLCVPPARGVTDTPGKGAHEVLKVCDACKNELKDENEIVDSLCTNNFILKIKVKEISYMNGDTKLTTDNKIIIYKLSGVTEHDVRTSPLWIRDGLECVCEEMSDIAATYLVMGQNVDGNLVITSLKRWQKGQRENKRLYRSIRKLQC